MVARGEQPHTTEEGEMVAEQQAEPRWKRAGSPYLLTRDELVEELRRRGHAVTASQIQFWITYGVLPIPPRGAAPLAPDRRHRALFPAYLIPVLEELLRSAGQDRTLAELRERAPALIEEWRAQVGEGPPPTRVVATRQVRYATEAAALSGSATGAATATATLSGGGSASPPIGSGAGLTSTPPVGTPRIPRAMQRVAWEYSARLVEERGQTLAGVVLTVRTEDGEQIAIPLPPPQPRGAVPPESDE